MWIHTSKTTERIYSISDRLQQTIETRYFHEAFKGNSWLRSTMNKIADLTQKLNLLLSDLKNKIQFPVKTTHTHTHKWQTLNLSPSLIRSTVKNKNSKNSSLKTQIIIFGQPNNKININNPNFNFISKAASK